jgi:hypothetical protein
MPRIIFFTEEPSMHEFLKGFISNQFEDWQEEVDWLCVPHEGKHDLERSMTIKLPQWNIPGERFLILRDKDQQNCVEVKQELQTICEEAGKRNSIIRIVCTELESWYFGDTDALATVYNESRLRDLNRRAKYRIVDRIVNPSDELKKIIPKFTKMDGARRLGKAIDPNRNISTSFSFFWESLNDLAEELNLPNY